MTTTDVPFQRLHEMTKAELEQLGCKAFNTTPVGTLMLFPEAWFNLVPPELKVTSITGDTARWCDKRRNNDQRWGALAYGVRVK